MRMEVKYAIDQFGTVASLAAALDISVQAVYQWGDTVPALRAFQIMDLIAARSNGGAISADASKEAA